MKEKNFELAKKLRHELHQHPELSNQEFWTKQHLIEFLKENTNLKIVDNGLWFYAIYRAGEDKPNIAFRADMDAIPFQENNVIPYASKNPGVAHKCGHDGHAAGLCALALEIDQNGADKNVFFLFQHAEETGDGAKQCKSFIKLNNIEEIFAIHSMSDLEYNSINVIDGTTQCASKGMIIHMEGSPTHASQPEHGKNPAYAIAEVVRAIPELISPEGDKGIILCTVVQIDVGERAFGMAASKGDLLLTIRALYEDEMDALQKKLEDFGHYTKLTKGAMCYIGNGFGYPHLHTPDFDFRDELIKTAVQLFKGLIEL